MDTETCQALLKNKIPQLEIDSVLLVQEGWDSLVLEVNGEWIFRFPRREEVLPGLEKEIRLLPQLAGRLPTSVPHVEYLARQENGELLFMGYRKIPGDRLVAASLNEDGLASELAHFLSALHDLPLEVAHQAGIQIQDTLAWRAEYLEFSNWACEFAFPLLPPILRQQAECYWEEYLQEEANFTFRPCLIHRDLGPEHILVDQSRLSGVIDWEDATVGDPAIDFAGLYGMNDPDSFAQVLSRYRRPVEASFPRRVAFYATIAPFYEIQYGLEIDDPEHIRTGVRALENGLGRINS